jgi:hypothetical protein
MTFGTGTNIDVANGSGISGANTYASWVVNNHGSVTGNSGVVLKFIGALTNTGTIDGTANVGVSMTGGGLFTNYAGGTVIGGSGTVGWGVSMATNGGGYGAVDNAFTNHGLIEGGAGGVQLGGFTRSSNDGTIQGGTIGFALNGGGVLTDSGVISGGTTAVQFGGHTASNLILNTGAVLNGALIGSNATGATNALTLNGSGTLGSAITHFQSLSDSGAWTLDSSASFDTAQVRSGGALQIGDGSHPNASLTVGSLSNSGSVTVDGALHVNGAVTGAGSLFIMGGMLDLGSTVHENIQFGAGGLLELDNSQAFGGTVSGFDPTAAAIDLRDIAFVGPNQATLSPTATGGTLIVKDLVDTARIPLVGDFSGATFVAQSDGHGGTLVFDPAAAANAQLASLLHSSLGVSLV